MNKNTKRNMAFSVGNNYASFHVRMNVFNWIWDLIPQAIELHHNQIKSELKQSRRTFLNYTRFQAFSACNMSLQNIPVLSEMMQ